MEYNLKLTLMDDNGNALVSTNFDEEYLRSMKQYPQIDIIDEIIKTMKLQHETGSPVSTDLT